MGVWEKLWRGDCEILVGERDGRGVLTVTEGGGGALSLHVLFGRQAGGKKTWDAVFLGIEADGDEGGGMG